MHEERLIYGTKTIESKRGGARGSQYDNQTFILSLDGRQNETAGEVFLGALAWSGSYKLRFQCDAQGRLLVLPGMNDFMSDYPLKAGEEFAAPPLVLAYSSCGTGQASRNLHRWARRYNLRDGDAARPIVLNNWEGTYFNFDEPTIRSIIDNAAELGVEMFVLDDGWFGTKYPRDNSQAGLGDWAVNPRKLPSGIGGLARYAISKGLRFGLWVEPEMVNPKSELAEKHPDWIIRTPNREPLLMRSQMVLDLSNPKVQEYIYGVMQRILSENPEISYIKWDCNRSFEDLGSTYLAPQEQGRLWIDYVRGLYGIYEKLARNFPKVIVQACSGGGGRGDMGAMRYHHEFWGSDNTDPWSRVFINWGWSYFFPAMAIGSHVTHSPNHHSHLATSIKFRFDVSMAERLGLELQPAGLTTEEVEWAKDGVRVYRQQLRDIVQLGDLYRLWSPYGDQSFSAVSYVEVERARAVVFAYNLALRTGDDYPVVRLQGLDPARNYTVTELMPARDGQGKPVKAFAASGKNFSGDFLMRHGVRIILRNPFESAVLLLE
jgi:alpha-galactosidase